MPADPVGEDDVVHDWLHQKMHCTEDGSVRIYNAERNTGKYPDVVGGVSRKIRERTCSSSSAPNGTPPVQTRVNLGTN